jgi:hypothetical protein
MQFKLTCRNPHYSYYQNKGKCNIIVSFDKIANLFIIYTHIHTQRHNPQTYTDTQQIKNNNKLT